MDSTFLTSVYSVPSALCEYRRLPISTVRFLSELGLLGRACGCAIAKETKEAMSAYFILLEVGKTEMGKIGNKEIEREEIGKGRGGEIRNA